MGRRETLKGPTTPALTQPTILVTQDAFFALGMGCPSPDLAVKYPVSRHPLPDPPSRTPEEYESTGYRSVEDILPPDLVVQRSAVGGRGESGRHSPSGPQPGWWVPANCPWNGEQVAPLGTQVAFGAHFGTPFPGAG